MIKQKGGRRVPLAEEVAEIANSVFRIPDQVRLRLCTVVLLRPDVGQHGGNLPVCNASPNQHPVVFPSLRYHVPPSSFAITSAFPSYTLARQISTPPSPHTPPQIHQITNSQAEQTGVVYAIELLVFPKAIPITVFESTSGLAGGEGAADMTTFIYLL